MIGKAESRIQYFARNFSRGSVGRVLENWFFSLMARDDDYDANDNDVSRIAEYTAM